MAKSEAEPDVRAIVMGALEVGNAVYDGKTKRVALAAPGSSLISHFGGETHGLNGDRAALLVTLGQVFLLIAATPLPLHYSGLEPALRDLKALSRRMLADEISDHS